MNSVCRTQNAIPPQRPAQPESALDLRKLVKHAQVTGQLHGQCTDRIIVAQKAAQQRGWNLPVSVIKEEFEDQYAERWQLDYHTARRCGSTHEDAEDAAQNAAMASLLDRNRYEQQNGGFKKNRIIWASRNIHRSRATRDRRERLVGLQYHRRRRISQPEDLVIAKDFCDWAAKRVGHRAVADSCCFLSTLATPR